MICPLYLSMARNEVAKAICRVGAMNLTISRRFGDSKPMQVRDVMQIGVKSVPLGTSVKQAFQMMREGGFRHLPVLDSLGKVVGIVSDRDLRNVVVMYRRPDTGAEDFFVSEDTTVEEIMVTDPVSVAPGDDVVVAVNLIRDRRLGCLIVSENDSLAGILTYVDLLDVLLKLLKAPAQRRSS